MKCYEGSVSSSSRDCWNNCRTTRSSCSRPVSDEGSMPESRGSWPRSRASRRLASARAFARCSSCVYAARPFAATSARTASARFAEPEACGCWPFAEASGATASTADCAEFEEAAPVSAGDDESRVRAAVTHSRTSARSRQSL